MRKRRRRKREKRNNGLVGTEATYHYLYVRFIWPLNVRQSVNRSVGRRNFRRALFFSLVANGTWWESKPLCVSQEQGDVTITIVKTHEKIPLRFIRRFFFFQGRKRRQFFGALRSLGSIWFGPHFLLVGRSVGRTGRRRARDLKKMCRKTHFRPSSFIHDRFLFVFRPS